ncbi:MAG TPA: hypothetical protein VMT54_15115 [Candidatus Cybelea sp.]|nr:hypothetical protein [Candidatus Cybelea sp.]
MRILRYAILAVVLLALGTNVIPERAGADDFPNRGKIFQEGDFKRSAKQMIVCVGALMKLLHPKLHFFTGTMDTWQLVAGSPKDDIDASTWAIAAMDKASNASHAKVLDLNASPQELDDAWGSLGICETQK